MKEINETEEKRKLTKKEMRQDNRTAHAMKKKRRT